MKKLLLLLLPLLCATSAVRAAEALDPEKAFEPSLEVVDAHTVAVKFRIADGYYLYRHRFSFAAKSAETALGEARIPPGKPKQDENFGQVETYRNSLTIPVPLTRGESGSAVISVGYQGCADVGVCYPPMTRELKVDPATLKLQSSSFSR